MHVIEMVPVLLLPYQTGWTLRVVLLKIHSILAETTALTVIVLEVLAFGASTPMELNVI